MKYNRYEPIVPNSSPETTTINHFPDLIYDLKFWHASVLFEFVQQAAWLEIKHETAFFLTQETSKEAVVVVKVRKDGDLDRLLNSEVAGFQRQV